MNKIEKSLTRLITKNRRLKSIINEEGEVTTDNTEVEMIIKTIRNNHMPIKWTTWNKWTNI